uniref:PDZ domain-containing protein n=2 Tax=Bombyx mori TaxID=7091 RepID=A0A8R2M471_BOMMO|nr:midasin isoform X1 [Bombyx mori]
MVMPPDMAVSMRHTKLKAEEAALIAGELTKPSWESRNEGIHERVSFEDTIWGFDLAGGIYYRTPLRVTFVKPDSRAEKAGIKPGDRLLRINDIDTSTLTIQQAHDLIVESGIHLKLAVTSPDDLEDAYYYYEDPIVEDYDSEEERLREEEKARKRQVHARVSSYWSLQWPWVSKRKIIYRESNCYLVPSKYEEKHRDKFPPQPMQRFQDDIVLHSAKDTSKNRVRGEKLMEEKNQLSTEPNTKLTNGVTNGHEEEEEEDNNTAINEDDSQEDLSLKSSGSDTIQNDEVINDNVVNKDENEPISQESETSDKPNDKEEEEEEKVNAEETDAMDVLEESSNGFQDLSQEMIKDNDLLKAEDDNNIIDSILSDNGQNMENLEAMNER